MARCFMIFLFLLLCRLHSFLCRAMDNDTKTELEHNHRLGCVCDAECDRIVEEDCLWGLTLDVCGCCLVCARGEGEPCGGALGSCAHQLFCVSQEAIATVTAGRTDAEVRRQEQRQQEEEDDEEETRTCSAILPTPTITCDKATSEERFGCYFVGGSCRCRNFTTCHHHPHNELDYFLFDSELDCSSRIDLLTANTGGGHLSINRHRDKSDDHGCSRVKCPQVLDCPSDSYRLPTSVHPEECCPAVNKCQCNPVLECPKPECPPGWTQQLVLNATGKPGRCCPLLECSPARHHQSDEPRICSYDGTHYKEGETWTHLEDCTECSCSRDGVVSCQRIKCDLPAQCLLARAPPGSCCPICSGCTTSEGKVYNNSDVWEEDACTLCECEEGRVKCHATMCQSQCENPIYVPGECCPRCAESEDSSNLCPARGKCDQECPFGYVEDERGCLTCECNNKCGTVGCHLDCPSGYEMDDRGCPICSCRNSKTGGGRKSGDYWKRGNKLGKKNKTGKNRLNKENRLMMAEAGEGMRSRSSSLKNKVNTSVSRGLLKTATTCHSSDGKDEIVRLDGEEWSDGCRQCVCKFGVEFCTLISCSPPECEHPIFYPGDCCPRCPDEDFHPDHVTNNVTMCPGSGLAPLPHLEGEQWEVTPCLKCTCHRGLTLCATQACPPAPCDASELLSPDDTNCCPRCRNPPSSSSSSNPTASEPAAASLQARVSELRSVPLRGTIKVDAGEEEQLGVMMKQRKNCFSDNFQLEYSDGEAWKVGPCQSCVCRDGRIECFSSSGNCPRLSCERPALAKNQCCPICLDDGGRAKTEMNCTVSGSNDTWLHGQSWMADKCTRCVCNAPLVQCTRIICSISCRKPLLYVEDECCPICPPDEDQSLPHHHHRSSSSILEPYYCTIVIGVLLALTSLLTLYVLTSMYRRRRRRRLTDRSSCSFSKPSASSVSCSSEDSSEFCGGKGSNCIGGGRKYAPCTSVSRSTSNNSCHGISVAESSAEEKLLCSNSV